MASWTLGAGSVLPFVSLLLSLLLLVLPHSSDACLGDECEEYLERVRLPEGFEISYFAQNIPGARSLVLSPNNVLYIGTRVGSVYAALDQDEDGSAELQTEIVRGLNEPNGMAFQGDTLWVVEIHRIIKYVGIDQALLEGGDIPDYVVVRSDLPTEEHHGWRYAHFNRVGDPTLFISVGAPCNICEVDDPYGTILSLDVSAGGETAPYVTVARGIRNSVGFDWHPVSGEMWFTDNGRDQWGNNMPPDELNRIAEDGLHYGFPYCYGRDLVDDEYNDDGNCDAYVPASQPLGPHVAALGMRFYNGDKFPSEYYLNAFIAEHGSWNREVPIGYRISRVVLNSNYTGPVNDFSYGVFADGWLPDDASAGAQSWGRVVDLVENDNGDLLVSDDKNDCVYLIQYNNGTSHSDAELKKWKR